MTERERQIRHLRRELQQVESSFSGKADPDLVRQVLKFLDGEMGPPKPPPERDPGRQVREGGTVRNLRDYRAGDWLIIALVAAWIVAAGLALWFGPPVWYLGIG